VTARQSIRASIEHELSVLPEVSVQSNDRAGTAGSSHFIANAAIGREDSGINVAARMIEMDDHRTMPDLLATNPGVFQTLTQLAVEAAISHAFFKSIHGQQVFTPAGRIMAIPGCASGRNAIE
jgi:hypothetical protein